MIATYEIISYIDKNIYEPTSASIAQKCTSQGETRTYEQHFFDPFGGGVRERDALLDFADTVVASGAARFLRAVLILAFATSSCSCSASLRSATVAYYSSAVVLVEYGS